MVVAVALVGIALAALVVLTPWHIGGPPAPREGLSSQRDAVSEVQHPAVQKAEVLSAQR
jgi:hypothetical protein